MSDMTPDQVIAQIDEWHDREVRYRCWTAPSPTTTTSSRSPARPASRASVSSFCASPARVRQLIDRESEQRNRAAAAAVGVAPPVLHLIQPGYCTIVPFVVGETMHSKTIAGHPERQRLIVEAVRACHDGSVFGNEIRVFDMIRDYTRRAREVGAPQPHETEWMVWVGQRIEKAMQRDEPAPVACHNNLLSENFILTPAGRLWVLDWEHGGMNDPYFDLGDFCVEHALTDDEERSVLTTYCGSVEEHRYARMMLYKLVVDLWWSIWAMIQYKVSRLRFDFYAYGTDRIARFCANAAHPDFEGWLAQV